MRMQIETVKLCGQYDLFYRRVKAILEKKIAINVFFPMALSFKHSLTAKVEGIFVKIQKNQNNFKPNALNLKYFIPCYQPWFLTFCTKNMILISHL